MVVLDEKKEKRGQKKTFLHLDAETFLSFF
jgi:hypothetical protein